MKCKKIIKYLDEILEVERFKDCCPNGLQVEGKEGVKKVATAVSASEETIDLAIDAGVDLLIVHHGLFWKGDSPIIVHNLRRKLKKIIDSGLNLVAYHLPLDAHRELGNNWGAAKEMGWTELEPFGAIGGIEIGVKGKVGIVETQEFIKTLESYYGKRVHVALGSDQPIQIVTLVSGGAHKMITEAAEVGADAFVTGSFDEPVWHIAKERGICFFAGGHHATEVTGPKLIGEHLEQHFGIPCSFINVENPF